METFKISFYIIDNEYKLLTEKSLKVIKAFVYKFKQKLLLYEKKKTCILTFLQTWVR